MKQHLFLLLLFGANSFSCLQNDQTDKLLINDYKVIFQMAIDHPELQQYFHSDYDASRHQIIFQFFGNEIHDKLKGVTKFER